MPFASGAGGGDHVCHWHRSWQRADNGGMGEGGEVGAVCVGWDDMVSVREGDSKFIRSHEKKKKTVDCHT